MSTSADGTRPAYEPRLFLVAAFLAALLHAGLAVVFYTLGKPAVAHWDVAGVAVHLMGAAFIARGKPFTGIWIVIASANLHISALLIAFGPESGFGYYFLTLMAIPILLFRQHLNQVVVGCLISFVSAVVGVAGAFAWGPWVTLDEAPLAYLRAGNLIASTGTLVIFGILSAQITRRTQRQLVRLQREVAEARQLGQYTLGEKLGEGGMGQVYSATHALLRRPAAIKLLPEGEVSEVATPRTRGSHSSAGVRGARGSARA